MNLNFEDFEPIDPREMFELIKNDKREKTKTFPLLNIDYVELYSFLKFKFGNPNGIQSILRSDDSNNLYHWNFSLTNKLIVIDFVYSYRCVRINVFSVQNGINLELQDEIIDMIKWSLKKNRKEINLCKKKLEHWDLFQNTFLRLSDTVSYFYFVFMENYPDEIVEPTYDFSNDEIQKYLKKTKKNLQKINTVKSYGLSLRMLIPVLGESFINFVIFILGKDEIKTDKRIFETITRNNIDARIKTLHLNIKGMDNPINQSNEFVKRFFILMGNRNDFLHGNVVPKVNTFDNVYFDGNVPIFNNPRDMNKEFSTQALFQISKEQIDLDYKTIDGFIKYIMSCINEEYRAFLHAILQTRELGWNKSKKIIGILFPPQIVDSFPGVDSESSKEKD